MKTCLYYYSLALASLILFLYGFFPVQRSHVTDVTQPPTFLGDIELNVSHLYRQEVDRIIMVIIDALRLDFITEENMPFVVSAFRKQGCMLSIRVESPTVTLPRIKALTTGSIPQFVDVILNLASTEIVADSILHRAVDKGKKIVFYGDDTWIKLYPDVFKRHEGVSSFYVNDFTEVDNNVTRNLYRELNKEDWDIMFLHYLGLDHIGHVFGPYSNLVLPKLREMDKIIEEIYTQSQLWKKRTLIIVTGDHGMKDSGGHGGSTAEETHVPLISIGISCEADSVAQIDIPSTLGVLMGLTFPANNIGRIILNMFHTFPTDRILYILRYNALSLQTKTTEHMDIFKNASFFHYKFLKVNDENAAVIARKLYLDYCNKVGDTLIRSSIKQDDSSLLIAISLLLCCFFGVFYDLLIFNLHKKHITKKIILLPFTIFIFQFIFPKSLPLIGVYLFGTALFILPFLLQMLKSIVRYKPACDIKSFLAFCTILYALSLWSSSFIEEEHQVWYYFYGTFIIISCRLGFQRNMVILLLPLFLALRLLRTLNQTGDKWAHLPDLSQWLLLQENYIYLQIFICTSLVLLWLSCFSLSTVQINTLLLNTIIIILIYVFHVNGTQSPLLGKLIWFLIFIKLCINSLHFTFSIGNLIVIWTLFSALLMRSYNIILLPACIYASLIIRRCVTSVEILTVVHIWLGKTFFFLQGHSNSLANVDIAAGYVGLQEYIPLIVITQVLCHTYAFPILTHLLILKHCFPYSDRIWHLNIVYQLLVIVITCMLILIQRHHLFVWTVFAPKLLIESSHSAMLFIEIVVFYSVIFIRNIFVKIKLKNKR